MSLSESSNRISFLDSLKGFTILCVIIGHVALGYLKTNVYSNYSEGIFRIYDTMYSFHMPLFMMISGYVFSMAYFKNLESPSYPNIRRQTINNIIVYLWVSILFLLLKIPFGKFTATDNVTFSTIAMIWAKPYGIYWYLYALILFYPLFSIPIIHRGNKVIVFIVLLALNLLSPFIHIGWFDMPRLLYHTFFFYIGFLSFQFKDKLLGNKLITPPARNFSPALLPI